MLDSKVFNLAQNPQALKCPNQNTLKNFQTVQMNSNALKKRLIKCSSLKNILERD